MTLNLLFYIANIYITPLWIGMVFFPSKKITQKVFSSHLFLLPLIGIYLYYVIATLDLESAKALFEFKLSGLATFLSEEGSAGGAWIHFLIMDLFVGRWIYWQGREKNLVTAHSLILCLLLGPAGLLAHLITVYLFDRKSSPETIQGTDQTS